MATVAEADIAYGSEGLGDRLTPVVRQVMQVSDVTTGGTGYAVRFRGSLMVQAEQAYDHLKPLFAHQGLTLMMRAEGDSHIIMGVEGLIRPKPSNPVINLLLFGVTLFSVLLAGALYGYAGPQPSSLGELLVGLLQSLPSGIPFAASLLAILLAHEFGHYLAARFHNTAVTLPYFLPFPGSPFGTLGAFIQLKEPPRNRRVLLDIGLAGPLAGLVVAIPILLLGLAISDVTNLPSTARLAANQVLEGNSILYLASKFVVTGKLLPEPVSFGAGGPVVYWIRYFFLGIPTPLGGLDVQLSPVAWAGWAGLLVTALNLIPAGQLDGGHVLYVLLGKRAGRLLPYLIVGLIALGMVWSGWWLWAALIFFLGRTHAQPMDEITPLDPTRKALAILGLLVFLVTFTPVPLRAMIGG
jgi:membrane-associated protease RseP (regulator of RpoE activity)